MKSFAKSLLPILFLALLSCGTQTRGPSSAGDSGEAQQQVQLVDQLNVNIAQKTNAQWELERSIQETSSGENLERTALETKKIPVDQSLATDMKAERSALSNLSRALSTRLWSGVGPWYQTISSTQGIVRQESFAMRDPSLFRIGLAAAPPFALDHLSSSGYRLRLENQFVPADAAASEVSKPLKAQFQCDGDFSVETVALFAKTRNNLQSYDFDWYPSTQNGQKILLEFSPNVRRCVLKFAQADTRTRSTEWTHQVFFEASESLLPFWKSVASGTEVCARPVAINPTTGPVAFFWAQDFKAVTCPQLMESFEPLRNPLAAFNEKIKSLTGSDLPETVLKQKNPTVSLDFSKAPQLDVIWVSSLSFTADLYGAVLSQALRFHADHGVQIRILVPRARVFRKDQELLSQLQRGRPNVKVQIYNFVHSNGKEGDLVDTFHRVNHAKILLGYSEKNPANSFVVTGGRNVGDPYLLKSKPDYAAYPWLINYKGNERPFIFYDDFEVKIKGGTFAKSILTQMIGFWNRDSRNQLMRTTTLNADYRTPTDVTAHFLEESRNRPFVRHILSVPYADGRSLERFYVQMLDSAQKEILVTTPYFTPSDALSEAFHRAYMRGVKVKVLTGMSLAGDDIPSIVEDANKKGVNRHVAELEIYQWTVPASIMHAKLLVIDEKLSFISSVNLNGRSFSHDTESGVLILHEATGQAMKKEILGYLQTSERMTEELKIKWMNGLLLKIIGNYF